MKRIRTIDLRAFERERLAEGKDMSFRQIWRYI